MKKSVAVILVLAVLALFLLFSKGNLTGWQMLDLPAPPSPPGMGGDEEVEESYVDYEEDEEEPYEEYVYEESYEEPVEEVVQYVPVATSDVSSRLDSIEKTLELTLTPALRALQEQFADFYAVKSDVDALKVETRNLRQQPSVEFPLSVTDIEGPIKRNLILTVSFFVFVILIIAVMISVAIINHHNDVIDNKRLLRQYLVNYQKAGYRLDTLKMHLRACGWKDDMIEEVVRELPK